MVSTGSPDCVASSLRDAKVRPSRIGVTAYTTGGPARTGRRKYACNEWIRRPGGAVRVAAWTAWATTNPPNR